MPHPYKSSPKKLAYYQVYIGTPEGAAKHAARMTTRRAIRRGELARQPCEKCGGQKSEVHHKDYSEPLDVRWLCKPCHAAEHRKTHCFRGHELSGDNLVFIKGKRHSCRACRAIQARDRYRATKAERSPEH
jgi:hypothetical protein